MGLDLEVGMLADLRENDEEAYESVRKDFDSVNQHLKSAGLKQHDEPDNCEVWSCSMYGYSGLHYLRRIAAYLDSSGKLPPPGNDEASKDPVLEKYFQDVIGKKPSFIGSLFGNKPKFKRGFDHLIVHSDAEGFYLPIDFADVQFPDDSLKIPGAMIGSTYRLVRECERIAEVLGIPSHLDENSEELFEAADSQGEGDGLWEQYGIESYSCVCLLQGCRKSNETGAALVFC